MRYGIIVMFFYLSINYFNYLFQLPDQVSGIPQVAEMAPEVAAGGGLLGEATAFLIPTPIGDVLEPEREKEVPAQSSEEEEVVCKRRRAKKGAAPTRSSLRLATPGKATNPAGMPRYSEKMFQSAGRGRKKKLPAPSTVASSGTVASPPERPLRQVTIICVLGVWQLPFRILNL
jgi:hypothetical protein